MGILILGVLFLQLRFFVESVRYGMSLSDGLSQNKTCLNINYVVFSVLYFVSCLQASPTIKCHMLSRESVFRIYTRA